MKSIKQLKKEYDEARIAYQDAEDEELKRKLLPKLKARLGQCFKYRNSYGGNKDDWWLYERVVGIEDGVLMVDSFQECSDGRIEIKQTDKKMAFRNDPYTNNSYIPIDVEEYRKAQAALLEKVSQVLK